MYTLGGENATLTEFLAAIAQATGTERTVFALPKAMAKSFGAAAELMGYLGSDPLITREWAELLTCNWPASSDRARDELGYKARGIAQGIRETVNWLEAGCPSPFSTPQLDA